MAAAPPANLGDVPRILMLHRPMVLLAFFKYSEEPLPFPPFQYQTFKQKENRLEKSLFSSFCCSIVLEKREAWRGRGAFFKNPAPLCTYPIFRTKS